MDTEISTLFDLNKKDRYSGMRVKIGMAVQKQ